MPDAFTVALTAPEALRQYKAKRDFSVTSEPPDDVRSSPGARSYVIQRHWARRLHYDFRLEFDGITKNWAVPKGPSLDPRDKRMAIEVEDHTIAYSRLEGTVPARQYGAGKVYALLHESMREAGFIGIASEIRPLGERKLPADGKASAQLKPSDFKMAAQLISNMTGKWKPGTTPRTSARPCTSS